MTITGVSDTYTLLAQQETVTALVTSGGVPVSTGQVTFTDAGQSQTVNVGPNGMATVTFTFGFFQEQPRPHAINASYADGTTFAASSTTSQAPDTTLDYLFQILIDYELLLAFSRLR